MARQYVGYTSRGATVFRNVRRDREGYPLVLLEEGETKKVTLDLAGLLESGETLSSAAVTTEGVTASISTSGSASTLTLSGGTAWGAAVVTFTLSSGEIIVETVRTRLNSREHDPEVAYIL